MGRRKETEKETVAVCMSKKGLRVNARLGKGSGEEMKSGLVWRSV